MPVDGLSPRGRRRASRPPSSGSPCATPQCSNDLWQPTQPVCQECARRITLMMIDVHYGPSVISERRSRSVIAKSDHKERQELAMKSLQGNHPGFVYYLLVVPHVKIGYSANLPSRMRAYPPTSELLAIEPGSLQVESQRHQDFAAFRQAGREWFGQDASLMQHIERLRIEHGDPARYAHRYGTGKRQ